MRAIRQARGLRQDELAERARITTGYLSRIETGKRRAESGNTEALAAALNIDIEILTGQRPAIRLLREALGITIDELMICTGLTRTRLARIEQGAEIPDADLIPVIANRLGVDPAALQPNVHRYLEAS